MVTRPDVGVRRARPATRLQRLRTQSSSLCTRGCRSWEKVASKIKGAQKYVLKFPNFCGYQKTTGMCGEVLFGLTLYIFQRRRPGRGRGVTRWYEAPGRRVSPGIMTSELWAPGWDIYNASWTHSSQQTYNCDTCKSMYIKMLSRNVRNKSLRSLIDFWDFRCLSMLYVLTVQCLWLQDSVAFTIFLHYHAKWWRRWGSAKTGVERVEIFI